MTTNINPFAADAKNVRVKKLSIDKHSLVEGFANFSASGSIKGMKKQFYGKGALLVRCGNFIYNVSSSPEIYNQAR